MITRVLHIRGLLLTADKMQCFLKKKTKVEIQKKLQLQGKHLSFSLKS